MKNEDIKTEIEMWQRREAFFLLKSFSSFLEGVAVSGLIPTNDERFLLCCLEYDRIIKIYIDVYPKEIQKRYRELIIDEVVQDDVEFLVESWAANCSAKRHLESLVRDVRIFLMKNDPFKNNVLRLDIMMYWKDSAKKFSTTPEINGYKEMVDFVEGADAYVTKLKKGFQNILEKTEEDSSKTTTSSIKKGLTPDSKWEEIKIKFLNGVDVEIFQNDLLLKTTNSLEMGFVPKKGEQESLSWVFLKMLAKIPDNQISWGDKGASPELRSRKKATIKALKKYFGINDDPFFPTKKIKGYKARFTIISENKKNEPYLNTDWEEWEKPKGIATADL